MNVLHRARLPRLRPAGSPVARLPSNGRKRGRSLASGAGGVRPGSRSVPGGPCSSPGHAPRPSEGRSRLGTDRVSGPSGHSLPRWGIRFPRRRVASPESNTPARASRIDPPPKFFGRSARSRHRTTLETDATRISAGRRAKGPRGAPATLACPGAPRAVWSWMIEPAQEPQLESRDHGAGQPRIGGRVGTAPGPSRTSLGSSVTRIRSGGVANAGPRR
jgi:hypothetical protein